MSNKHAVLCITRQAVMEASGNTIPEKPNGIYPFNLYKVPDNAFHFIHRDIVDSAEPIKLAIAREFPHLISNVIVKCQDKYLTFPRKGTEKRLHGSWAMTFGGHVDIFDFDSRVKVQPFAATFFRSAERELHEELGLVIGEYRYVSHGFDHIIVDHSNEVGSVHLGLTAIVEIDGFDLVTPSEETAQLSWVTKQEMLDNLEQYESWAKILINSVVE